MFDHRIVPINASRKLVLFPEQIALMTIFRLLQHKTEPGIRAFVLDTVQATSPALEADTTRLSQAHTIEGLIGTRGQRLRQHRIQMLGNPSTTSIFSIVM